MKNKEVIKQIAKAHLHPKLSPPGISTFNPLVFEIISKLRISNLEKQSVVTKFEEFVIQLNESIKIGADTKKSRAILIRTGSLEDAKQVQIAYDNIELRKAL